MTRKLKYGCRVPLGFKSDGRWWIVDNVQTIMTK